MHQMHLTHPQQDSEPLYTAPASMARVLDRGIYYGVGVEGQWVVFGVTSKRQLLLGQAVEIAPSADLQRAIDVLSDLLDTVDADPFSRMVPGLH
jgi:hypothetical protein